MTKEPIEMISGMTPAQQAKLLRDSEHMALIRDKIKEKLEQKAKYEQANAKAKAERKILDEITLELDELEANGPPDPDPQLKLPLDTDLNRLSMPGEIQDLLLDAGIETIAELGEIIKGTHDDYEKISDIGSITNSQADQAMACYRLWVKEQEKEIAQEMEKEGVVVEDEDDEEMEPVDGAPDESNADKEDNKKKRVKAKILMPIEQYKEGDEVVGRRLEDGLMVDADEDGEEMYLNDGEFEIVG